MHSVPHGDERGAPEVDGRGEAREVVQVLDRVLQEEARGEARGERREAGGNRE